MSFTTRFALDEMRGMKIEKIGKIGEKKNIITKLPITHHCQLLDDLIVINRIITLNYNDIIQFKADRYYMEIVTIQQKLDICACACFTQFKHDENHYHFFMTFTPRVNSAAIVDFIVKKTGLIKVEMIGEVGGMMSERGVNVWKRK